MVKKLNFSGAILCCAAICALCAEARAQVPYGVPQLGVPNWGAVLNTPIQNVPSNCPCGCGENGRCVENPGNCDLWVTPGHNSGTVSSRPYPVTPPKDCKGSISNISFYRGEQRCNATIKVPKKVEQTEEKYKFERKTWNVCGCKVSVCVPCEIETICSTQCQPADETVELIAKIRTRTGKADIWVEGVTGLPSEAVLGLNMTSRQANQRFPGATFSY